MPSVHLVIKGKVQGVFYRSTALVQAGEAGVTGWIKNQPDGNVEAVVTGSVRQINVFVSWCRRGPAAALVADVIVNPIPEEQFKGFTIKRI